MAQTVYVLEGKGVYITSTTWDRTSTTKQIGATLYTYYNYFKNIRVGSSTITFYARESWDTATGSTTITKTAGGIYTGIDKTQSGQPRSTFYCNLVATNLYTVTATSNGNGSVSPTSTTVLHGAKVTLTATPAAHYTFQRWSDGNTSATREITVTSDINLSATFVQSEWRLYAQSASASQGSVTLSGWTSGSYFAAGTTKNATANPAAGYRFTGWHKNGSATAAYTTATAALKLDSADTTYEARFVSTSRVLSVTTPTPALGTLSVWVNGTSRTPSASMAVNEGDSVRILSAPAYNATGGAWSVTGRSPGGAVEYTFTVAVADPATIACVATFTQKTAYTLTLAIEHPEKGAVTFKREGVAATAMGPSTVTVYAGVTYTLTATVTNQTLDMFRGWYDNRDGTLVSDQLELSFTAERNVSLTAVFAEKPSYALAVRASDGTIPYIQNNAAYNAGCRAVCERVPDFTNPDRFLAGNVLVTATCAEGWRVAGWLISNVDQGSGGSASLPGFHDTEFRFELSFNATFTFIFERIPVTVSCSVDTASTGIGTVSCSVVNASEEGVSVTARHGDSVVFTAVLIGDSGSYAFEGWYGADGGKVSGNASHTVENVSDDLHLLAKFAAKVSVAVSATTGATAANASANVNGAAFAWIVLGGTCLLTAAEGENAHFSGWYDAADTTFANPLAEIGQTEEIAVARTLSLVARFISTQENSPHYLAVINYDNNNARGNPALGIITLSGADVPGSGITSITEAEWNALFPERGPMGAEPGEPPQSGNRYFRFDGVKTAQVIAAPAANVGFMRWRRLRWLPGEEHWDSAPVDAGTSPTLNFVSNNHYILYVDWGEPAPVNVSILYAQGSDATAGGFTMSPTTPKAQTIQNGIRDVYVQGTEITLEAFVRNGFLFLGWFYDADGTQPVTLSAENTFTVYAAVTLYAKFAQDGNAIYLWNGSDENKMMEWRGMRAEFDRPVNMSSARVDAAGYPVTLQLYAASSPDAPSPDRPTVSVAVRNQNGMRLPMARPERYLEVCVRSKHAVTGFAVATSMEGLR